MYFCSAVLLLVSRFPAISIDHSNTDITSLLPHTFSFSVLPDRPLVLAPHPCDLDLAEPTTTDATQRTTNHDWFLAPR